LFAETVTRERSLKGKIMRPILSLLVGLIMSFPHFLAAQQQEIEDNFNSGRWDKNIVHINDLFTKMRQNY